MTGEWLEAAKRAKELIQKEKPKSLDEWWDWYTALSGENDRTLWAILHATFAPVAFLPTEKIDSISRKTNAGDETKR